MSVSSSWPSPRDVRCPVGAKKLLMRLVLDEDHPPEITDGNLMDLYCKDCSRAEREADPKVLHVRHRFDMVGTLVESVFVWKDGHIEVESAPHG